MKALFRMLTIKAKLALIIIVALLSIIASQIISLNELWTNLNENKKVELKHITQVAYSILEQQNSLVQQNKITKAQAIANTKADIRGLRYGNNEYFFLFDNQYNMVLHPIKEALEKSPQVNLADSNGFKFFKSMVDNAIATGESTVDYVWPRAGSSLPVPKTSYGKYLAELNIGVATGLYTDDIADIYWAEVKSAGLSITVILVLLSIVVYQAAISIVKPLRHLEKKIVEIAAEKDLTIRSKLRGKDELADISRAFNSMLDAFDSTLHEMNIAAEQVANASTELSATTTQTLVGMDTQKSETHQVASAMTEMSTTVHDVATNTVEAAHASDGAAKASEVGKQVVSEAQSAVKKLADKLQQAEELTHNLETQTENISSILSVITSIADQTNLLALNAAIEAARAGEHGRGFAVVADEVRSLSSRTHESTDEIHQVISELQAGSLAAVNAMKESKLAADEVEVQASDTEKALTDITNAVEQIDSMTNQIATASEQQSAVAEEINRNISNISDVTDESAIGAQQISVASEELASLATKMKDDVQKFKFTI